MVSGVTIESFMISSSDKSSELDYRIKKIQGWKCKWCDRSIENAGHIYYRDTNCNNRNLSNMISLCTECYHEAKLIEDDNFSYLGILFR